MTDTPSDSRPGDIFQPGDLLNNTYRIEEMLGRGGTSEVYKARSEISNRIVALKALKSEFSTNDDFLVLMTREEEIRDIRHDAVVRYYDNQRMPNGVVYLVMDYVDGTPLDRMLSAGGMSADDLMVIGARVCEGLVTAHAANIVHRDLSPDNIILRNDKPSEAVIIDFGIAKDTNPGAETIVGNEFAGKYAYAAPEQLNGQTDARSDLYSLGALLLSTFRGKKPDIGSNPMEVLQRKGEPLDTSNVPQPLAGIIAKLSDPNPAARFQTASEALAGFRSGTAPAALDDATVIAPRPVAQNSTQQQGGSGGLIAAGLVLLAGLAGGGAYLMGMFEPSLPTADPYTLSISKPEGGMPQASGFVPTPEVETALSDLIIAEEGTVDLTLATGDIPEGWGADVIEVLGTVSLLDEYQVALSGTQLTIVGMSNDKSIRAAVSEQLTAAMPQTLTAQIDIIQGPRILSAQSIELIAQDNANCGPLTLVGAPATGYGLDGRVIIEGKLASTQSRTALFEAVSDIAGDREVTINTEILSPALCLIEDALPKTGSGGFDVQFGFGDRAEPNPSGRYFVGENPVIDVTIPSGITDGYLWVSVLDVSGNVFHLLPNVNRSENSVTSLREDQTGPVMVRVAYSLEQASNGENLAFLVDDSTLGKSKIIVLHSQAPLFDGVRPTTESAASYADALREIADQGRLAVDALDSAILTTAAK